MVLSHVELRKAQMLMLSILKEVHRVCDENGIQYFLSDGTLIGAVRHNGFIPWDDDLDIGMLRDDYEKFCKIAEKKLSSDFFLLTTKTDSNYALSFAKVILKNTLWIEIGSKNTKYQGIYIDIFPYDKVPKGKIPLLKRHFNTYRLINYFTLCKYGIRENSSLDNNYFIKKLIIFLIPKWLLQKYRNYLMIKYKNLKVFDITKYGGNLYNNLNDSNLFKNFVLHTFEDQNFYIPAAYDKILSKLYGNYMEIPPVEKRKTHEIVDYKF